MSGIPRTRENDISETVDDRAASLTLSTLLATAGGYLDGYTFVGHGHVFANAMTGNVVLLGIEVLGSERQRAYTHLPPILTFLCGVWVAKLLHLRAMNHLIPNPYAAVLILEIALLSILSCLPSTCPDILITTIVAFTASLQVQTFRTVQGHSYTSTFTTGNLRSLSEALFDCVTRPDQRVEAAYKARVFAIICVGFLFGAAAGGSITHVMGNKALWVELFFLVFALRKTLRSKVSMGGESPRPPRFR